MRVLLVALVACLLLAGCSSSPKAVDGTETLAPDAAKEVNLRLDAGKRVEWSWTSSVPLDFNVHSHAGGKVTYHVQGNDDADEGSFTAPGSGGYSIFWHNTEGTAAVLQFSLRVHGTVDS